MIKKLDKWSTGDTLGDLVEYAMAEGYDAHEVRLSRCATRGGHVFGFTATSANTPLSVSAAAEHFIVDCGDYWDGDAAAIMVCECSDDTESEERRGRLLPRRRRSRNPRDRHHQPPHPMRKARILGRLDNPSQP